MFDISRSDVQRISAAMFLVVVVIIEVGFLTSLTRSEALEKTGVEDEEKEGRSSPPGGDLVYEEEEDEDGGQLLVLRRETLARAIKEFELLFVNFYASTHPASLLLDPEFSLAAEMIRTQQPEVRFARMSSDELEDGLRHRYRIGSPAADGPTLVLFRDGQAVRFDREPRAADLAAWIRRKTGTIVADVTDPGTLERVADREVIVVVGLFMGPDQSEPLGYLRVAEEMEEEEPRIRFLVTDNARIFSHLNVHVSAAIVLLKKFDGGRAVLTGTLTEARIREFLRAETVACLVPFTRVTSSFVRNHEIVARILLFAAGFNRSEERGLAETVEGFAEASKLHRGKILFVIFNVDEVEGRKELEQFGSPEECPLLVFVGPRVRRLPNAPSPLTKDQVEAFIRETYENKKDPEDYDIPEHMKIEL